MDSPTVKVLYLQKELLAKTEPNLTQVSLHLTAGHRFTPRRHSLGSGATTGLEAFAASVTAMEDLAEAIS